MMMKKLFALPLLLTVLLGFIVSANAAMPEQSGVPAEITAVFSAEKWTDYYVPSATNVHPALGYQDQLLCLRQSEDGSSAVLVVTNGRRSSLCILERQYGVYQMTHRSRELLRQNGDFPFLLMDPSGDSFTVQYYDDVTSALCSRAYQFYRHADGDWYMNAFFSRRQVNGQSVATYAIAKEKEVAYTVETASGVRNTVVKGQMARRFIQSGLSNIPWTLEEGADTLTLPPDIPATGRYNTLPQPRTVNFTANKQYAVYSGPGALYARGADGKATVNTNDWIQVFGIEDDWAMIQYDINDSHLRIGYISADALPKNVDIRALAFTPRTALVSAPCNLTDDPLNSQTPLARLTANTAVTYLCHMGADWVYADYASASGNHYRGFLPARCVSLTFDEK